MADSYDELWHKSHGHMSERELHIVAEKDLLPYVKGINLEKCVDCLLGWKAKHGCFHSASDEKRTYPRIGPHRCALCGCLIASWWTILCGIYR